VAPHPLALPFVTQKEIQITRFSLRSLYENQREDMFINP
jgi:hypothetical protein